MEVHLGYGWYSVDSADRILGAGDRIRGLEVRAPGGDPVRVEVADGQNEVILRLEELR